MSKEQAICSECGRPVTVFLWDGKVRNSMKDHDLCQKCWKAEKDRQRAYQFIAEAV